MLLICVTRDFLHLTAALFRDGPGKGHGLVANLAGRDDAIVNPAAGPSFLVAIAALDELEQVHLVLVKGEVLLHRAKLRASRDNLSQRSLFHDKGIALLILLYHSLVIDSTILFCLLIDSLLSLPRTLPDQLQKHLVILTSSTTQTAFHIPTTSFTDKPFPFASFTALFVRVITTT